jgi:hypothetical protein
MIGRWIKRSGKNLRHLGDERGISTLDWIGLTAVVLTLLTAIIFYGQTAGGRQLGAAMASGLRCQTRAWDHGGRCSGGGSYRYGEGYTPSGFSDSGSFSGGSGLSSGSGASGGGGGGAAGGTSSSQRPWYVERAGEIKGAGDTLQHWRAARGGFEIVRQGPDTIVRGSRGLNRLVDLPPGKYRADNIRVAKYYSPKAAFKSAFTKSNFLTTLVIEGGKNLYDYTFGEHKDKGVLSTDFAASTGVDVGTGILTTAASGAIAVGVLGATAPAWVIVGGTVAVGVGIGYLLNKTGITDALKRGTKNLLDRGKNFLKNLF